MPHRRDRPDYIDRELDAIDLRIDAEDLTVDKATIKQMALFRRSVRADLNRMEKKIMGRLDSIIAAQAAQSTALANLATQQQQLADQIAGLVAGSVTQEEIDAVAATAQANADAIQAAADAADALIEPDAGEGEPPPSPEEPV